MAAIKLKRNPKRFLRLRYRSLRMRKTFNLPIMFSTKMRRRDNRRLASCSSFS